MWIPWIMVALLSVTSYYSVSNQTRSPDMTSLSGAGLAANMYVYRTAVMAYAASQPNFSGTVATGNLTFPQWYTALNPPLWTNYIDSKGIVTVYSSALPNAKMTADLARLSRNSMLAGEANSTTGTLYSPAFGNTGILLPTGMATPIPDKSPVWMTGQR